MFLVAGGEGSNEADYLIAGSSSWVMASYIPGGIGAGARGISFQNRFLVTGKCSFSPKRNILQLIINFNIRRR